MIDRLTEIGAGILAVLLSLLWIGLLVTGEPS